MLQGDGWKAEGQRKMPRQKPGKSKQDYGTPKALIAAVLQRLGQPEFECDLAADATNRKAWRWVTQERDALTLPTWRYGAGWNWLNPPFAKIGPWVERAAKEWEDGVKTAVLIPASTGSEWWAKWVHERCGVVLLRPRPTFEGQPCNPKTGKADPYPKDVALLLYGEPVGYEIWRWK